MSSLRVHAKILCLQPDARYPRVAQRKAAGDRASPYISRWGCKMLSSASIPEENSDEVRRDYRHHYSVPPFTNSFQTPVEEVPEDYYDAVREQLALLCKTVVTLSPSKSTHDQRRPSLHLRHTSTKSLDASSIPQLVYDSADSSTTNSSATTPCSEVMPVIYPREKYCEG